VYVKFDGYQIIVMANDHIIPTDTIAFEPNVINAFIDYVKRLNKNLHPENEGGDA